MKTWRFGIVGAGMIAGFHAKAIRSLPNAMLTAVTGSNIAKARALGHEYQCRVFDTYQELLRSGEVDIVTIATPSGSHMEPAIEAAKNGIHVLCEKPIEISLERIDNMIAAHAAARTCLGGIFNYRFNDSTPLLKAAIDRGRFGTITYASVQVPWWRSGNYYKGSWHGTFALDGGGALMNQSIHMIDILRHLAGPIASLQAYIATLAHPIEAEDTATAILRFKNGALGNIYGTTASYPGQFRRLEITGTRGTVVQEENRFKVWQFDGQDTNDEKIIREFNKIEGGGGVSDPASINFEAHARNIAAFIRSIEEKRPFEIDGHEARKAVEIVLAIYKSANEGKPYFFG